MINNGELAEIEAAHLDALPVVGRLVAQIRSLRADLAQADRSAGMYATKYAEARADANRLIGAIDLDAYQARVGIYCEKAWPHENVVHDTLSVCEEAGELSRAVLKRVHGTRGTREQWTAEIRKEAVDVLASLLAVSETEGFSLAAAFEEMWPQRETQDINHDPIGK